jgi:hypothetical protein
MLIGNNPFGYALFRIIPSFHLATVNVSPSLNPN